jgi:hypothetical protein
MYKNIIRKSRETVSLRISEYFLAAVARGRRFLTVLSHILVVTVKPIPKQNLGLNSKGKCVRN